LTAGQVLHADDQPSPSVNSVPPGYKQVRLPSGAVVTVKDVPVQQSTIGNTTGKYDPSSYDLNRTSPFSGKQFLPGTTSRYDKDSAFTPADNTTYVTKQYDSSLLNSSALQGKEAKFDQPAYNGVNSASGWDKEYTTTGNYLAQNQTTALNTTTTSSDQNRSAELPPGKTDVFPYSDSSKQYLGPGAQNVPKGVNIKDNVVLSHFDDFTGLPDRPLTIDEVRDLINHGVTPDTKSPPPPESKPLNDPAYVPRPLRDMPTPNDERNDAVPPPGTMSMPQPPENSEPLPQEDNSVPLTPIMPAPVHHSAFVPSQSPVTVP
jgi:hypothetical protein